MTSRHRYACLVVGLGMMAALAAGCAAADDESEASPAPAGPATTTSGGMPVPDASVKLDPDTKQRCDALWSFGVFVYTAHTSVNASPEQKAKFERGIGDNEPKASLAVPTLASEIKALADHARRAVGSPDKLPLTPELTAANQRIVEHLRTTCKFKSG